MIQKMQQVLPHRVSSSLIPRRVRERLFRREDFDEPAREMIELVRLRNVPVQRGGVELSEQVDALEVRVDAVGKWNVHQTILARQRHRRLGPLFRQWKKPGPLTAAHDYRQHVADVWRHSFALLRHIEAFRSIKASPDKSASPIQTPACAGLTRPPETPARSNCPGRMSIPRQLCPSSVPWLF